MWRALVSEKSDTLAERKCQAQNSPISFRSSPSEMAISSQFPFEKHTSATLLEEDTYWERKREIRKVDTISNTAILCQRKPAIPGEHLNPSSIHGSEIKIVCTNQINKHARKTIFLSLSRTFMQIP